MVNWKTLLRTTLREASSKVVGGGEKGSSIT